ncbi:hypothetical protein PAXRUDRAFT_55325, partial [Paxillus rubicundulus Ve08.2h10]
IKEAPCEPYTVNMLIIIQSHLDLTSPLHAAVFVCLTTAFYAMAHIGELTTKTVLLFNPLHHVKPSDVQVERDRQGNVVTNFHLPRSKSAQNGKDINWARQDSLSDPHEVFDNHLKVNSPP